MINPSLNNFQIEFSEDFFPEELTKKYDEYLFHLNSPFKYLKNTFMESVQQLNIPGLNIQTLIIQGLDNTGVDPRNPALNPIGFPHTTQNRAYEGNEPWWNTLETTTFTVSLRNNILNWMYCYELFYNRYRREHRVNQFQTRLIMLDSAEVPMIKFIMSDCFLSTLPGMEFAFNQSFNESKTFDVGVQFNRLDVEFYIPEFKKLSINLKSKE
jgi:hypothetical protein